MATYACARVLFIVFAFGSYASPASQSQQYIHPLCDANFSTNSVRPEAKSVSDLTEIFQGISLPEGACVFNPALVHVAGRIHVLFGRVYTAVEPLRRCRVGHLDRPPFLDGWRGHSSNILAVLRIRKRFGSDKLQLKLMGYTYLSNFNQEDGRLFKDARGRVFVYLALPVGRYPKRAVLNTVSRVFVKCNRTTRKCEVSMGYPRLLSYFGSSNIMDKNWVPWNGTALMSFSHYGTLGPHSVFNWGTYDEPAFHTSFDAVAEHPLFNALSVRYGKLLHFSGGSPAILEPGGKSFLAVGHLKAHPGCFHPEVRPDWAKSSAATAEGGPEAASAEAAGPLPEVGSRCSHMARAASEQQKKEMLTLAFIFGHPSDLGLHYPLDYGFFFYRFSATPPFNITHISFGFVPHMGGSAREHTGIVFPIGLERMGPDDYMVAYGDGDQASKLMLISVSQVESLLWPLQQLTERLDDYTFCAIPCAGPTGSCAN